MEPAAITTPATALIAGLVTSLHCVGMCGPLACGLMPVRDERANPHAIASAYHVGRLMSYAVFGAVAGALGRPLLTWLSQPVLRWLPWLLVFFFVALALRWDRFLPKLPVLGRLVLWIQSWMRARSRLEAAAALGLATPFLPCGPLYFVLAIALLSGSALRGAEMMLAFALGTVPLLWLAQAQFSWVRRKLSALWLERVRIALALITAVTIAWRLRATLGLPGPAPMNFACH